MLQHLNLIPVLCYCVLCVTFKGVLRHLSRLAHTRKTYVLFEPIECFHSRDQHLCKFIGTKESVCIRKEFNSQRIGLGHQHGRRFIVLGHQYGRRDVMWKHSITCRVYYWYDSSHESYYFTQIVNMNWVEMVSIDKNPAYLIEPTRTHGFRNRT